MKTATKPTKKSKDESSARKSPPLQKMLKELLSSGPVFFAGPNSAFESQKYQPLPYRRIIE